MEENIIYSKYQLALFDEIKNGNGNIIIQAVAGSGKTSSILKCMDYIEEDKKIIFCAFNTNIKNELKSKVKKGVEVLTLHSIGQRLLKFNNKYSSIMVDGKFIVNNDIKNKLFDDYFLEEFKKECILESKTSLFDYKEEKLHEKEIIIRKKKFNILKNIILEITSKIQNINMDINNKYNIIDIIYYYDLQYTFPNYYLEKYYNFKEFYITEEYKDIYEYIIKNDYYEIIEPVYNDSLSDFEKKLNAEKIKNTIDFNIIFNSLKIFFGIFLDIEKNKSIDFNDMIWLPNKVNINGNEKYDYIFIDEAQDLNNSQFELIKHLIKENTRIIIVGDKRQSIYGFRGSSEYSMDNFKETYNAKEMPLSICYRCAKNIVKEAKINNNEIEEFENNIDGVVSQKTFLINNIDKLNEMYDFVSKNIEYGNIILSRRNIDIINFGINLLKRNRNVIIVGNNIKKEIEKIIKKYKINKNEKKEYDIKEFINIINVQKTKLELELEKIKDENKINIIENEIENIQITILLYNFDKPHNYIDFSNKIEKRIGDKELKNDEKNIKNYIILSTIHKAKGTEYDRVILININQSPYFKRQWNINEFNNLKYVAKTRAKKELLYLNFGFPK